MIEAEEVLELGNWPTSGVGFSIALSLQERAERYGNITLVENR